MFRLAAILLISLPALAQPAPRAFEVAAIKPHQGPMPRMGVYAAGNRVDAVDYAGGLIMFAYGLKNHQLIGGAPLNALGDTAYDVIAKAGGEGEPTQAEFRSMLQRLLVDRFNLKFHREQREMPVYDLVVDKKGPKLKPGDPDGDPIRYLHVNGRNYEITSARATMGGVVDAIANSFPGRPIIDKTGLTGVYDLKLTFTPQNVRPTEHPLAEDISIFTAVQEQLGLKLEAAKGMIDVLVVDHIEKPSEN